MVNKGEHMLKSFLIFSFYCLIVCDALGQDTTDVSDSSSIVLLDNATVNYPGKPLIMSLALPGLGQYYNRSPLWKTALFVGVEIGSILAYNYFQNEAERRKDDYQVFADLNWSLDNWVYNRAYPTGVLSLDRLWSSFSALTSLTGTHDLKLILSGNLANELNLTELNLSKVTSDSLDTNLEWILDPDNRGDVIVVRDRHFYENIGKYDQFVGGWNDARESWYWEEKDVGDSIEIVIKTPMKQNYIDQRFNSNRMLSLAKYSITVVMFNHVFSGIESVLSSQKKGMKQKTEKASINSKLSLIYNSSNPLGVGGLKITFNFL